MHTFDEDKGWFSIGFKPKSKDLKTFLEDLYEFDYFDGLDDEDIENSIVLDGRKVRIGLCSYKFDIFDEECTFYNTKSNRDRDEADFLELVQVKDKEGVQQATFEININLG